MTAPRKPRTPGFEQELVDLSLLAVYLGLHMGGAAVDPCKGELHSALIRAGQRDDRLGLIGQALSGMPQAIVPFSRRMPDIHLAASLMDELGRACFRTEGSAVDAGYFVRVGSELRYADALGDEPTRLPEVLDPFRTRALLHELFRWTDRPSVEVLDATQGDLLRLRPGTERFVSLKVTPPARRELADKPLRANVSLLKVVPKSSSGKATLAPQVSRVALGLVTLVRDSQSLLMRHIAPEFLMEMHAAALATHSPERTLFLHVDLLDSQFLSPLPDLMHTGAITQGWWAPLRDISDGLGGSWRMTTRLPRSTAIALLQNAPWMWSDDLGEWVRWAWWLGQHKPSITPLIPQAA
jgi:hypothetical protein